ncbi:hypothetical protein [Paraburkholderia sartisoli]|uniref:hypothetical protein n=1 Tax=Paraburkholderia sartisoli TaxID=83784 RepID=UPI0011602387|nr:hypothetical protein [Paraburkholderia sartisoli]
MKIRLHYHLACLEQAPHAHATATCAVHSSWFALNASRACMIASVARAALNRTQATRDERVDASSLLLGKTASSRHLLSRTSHGGRETS